NPPRVPNKPVGARPPPPPPPACVLDGSVAHELATAVRGTDPTVSVEHPSGSFDVTLARDAADPRRVTRSALLRTARLLMAGDVLVPRSVWDPAPTAQENSA
ncbi:PrpF domain-containing protein, partial [Streptomyces albidoflavus]